ncbi:GTPase domain-containing protein [Salinibacterium sp. SWN1162]|uniref:GTPase domain-containing protein n=1 Tax=Salinibacterium sp. SWN1162 TaxID=2792053 RepID=UPI0018CCC152|nr:GTPase domain-containing protein [Salinibacterium sp. SWN1162]MBH0009573.1 GTPase domain-containing protein [Salinibacterium sp. SWN1162]
MREQYFGADESAKTTPAAFKAQALASANAVAGALDIALQEISAQDSSTEHRAWLGDSLDCLQARKENLDAVRKTLAQRDVELPMRVVLMGQTMAGKSTLFEFLSEGDGSRVGEGGQRFSRDSCARSAAGLDIEVVDTPGVGAMDGQEDYEAAFAEVANADLILWVATNQAVQEQVGRALEALADLGKPIIVALNCREDVSDEPGLGNMLEDPELTFGGDALGNLAPIRRHLARAGSRYIRAVPIHAQAALVAISGTLSDNESRKLHTNSRIDALLDELRSQAQRTVDQRRLISISDSIRTELMDTISATQNAHEAARRGAAVATGLQNDFRTQGLRRVNDASEELKASFDSSISARERWADHVDVDQGVDALNRHLDEEVELLRAELKKSVSAISGTLESDLQMIAVDVAEDWAAFDTGSFRGLNSRASIWGNRAVKAGGRFAVGMGGLFLGAKIGALAGTALGPGLGNAIGLVVGSVVGLVAGLVGVNKLIDWIGDKTFRSAEEVHKRRREKVRAQVSELLEELREDLETANETVRREWLDAVDSEVSRQATSCAILQRTADVLQQFLFEELEPAIMQIDAELACELLRNSGRVRAATAVTRATRWRGAGIAVELSDAAYSELVLFPLEETVDRIIPTSANGFPGTNALQIIRRLTNHALTINRLTADELDVSLDANPAPGIREAWEALAAVHAGVDVHIRETGGGQL